MRQFIRAARYDEIPEGTGKVIQAAGRSVAVFHANGEFYAIDNQCLHQGGPLGEGEVYGTRVICPWHGWEYDFATGYSVDDPSMRVSCIRVRVEGDDILLEI